MKGALAAFASALTLMLAAGGAAAQQAASQMAEEMPHALPTEAAKHELYYGAVLLEQNEFRSDGRGNELYTLDGTAWYGTDYDKVQLNLRGESTQALRQVESAELQLLYSRLIAYYWGLQFGVRHDFRIDAADGTPGRTYGMVGLQGLAPGFFEVNLQAFLGERGLPLFRAKASYDLLITNRLVLQPEVELDFAAGEDEAALIAPGLYRVEAGLRLRYEVTREFAPYIGVAYERAVGGASGLVRRLGQDPEAVTAVAGIRLFF